MHAHVCIYYRYCKSINQPFEYLIILKILLSMLYCNKRYLSSLSWSWRKSVLNMHWKDWCQGWSSNNLATWCKELTHWKRPWCWERLKAGGEGDNRGWDGWMASLTQWTCVWASSRSWWWTGKPGMLQSMGSQSWTRLSDWTELKAIYVLLFLISAWWVQGELIIHPSTHPSRYANSCYKIVANICSVLTKVHF